MILSDLPVKDVAMDVPSMSLPPDPERGLLIGAPSANALVKDVPLPVDREICQDKSAKQRADSATPTAALLPGVLAELPSVVRLVSETKKSEQEMLSVAPMNNCSVKVEGGGVHIWNIHAIRGFVRCRACKKLQRQCRCWVCKDCNTAQVWYQVQWSGDALNNLKDKQWVPLCKMSLDCLSLIQKHEARGVRDQWTEND
jgi:hypothetical protein